MKPVIILSFSVFAALIFLCCTRNHKPQPGLAKPAASKIKDTIKPEENEYQFSNLDSNEILKKLFDDPVFEKHHFVAWKPNFYERKNYGLSDDGKCHTRIDTIMHFTDREKRNCAVFIFGTYLLAKNALDDDTVGFRGWHFASVPLGIALFAEIKDKTWELYEFRKAFASLGYFGEYKTNREDAGKIRLLEIGDKWTCLSLRQGVGGNSGVSTGWESLYSIEQYQLGGFPNNVLSHILFYNYFDAYSGLAATDKIKEEKTTLHFIKKKKDYYDLDMITSSKGKTSTLHLKYSDDHDRYIDKDDEK